MAFPPPQKNFGFGRVTIKEIYSIHDINKLISSIGRDADIIRVGGAEMKSAHDGQVNITDTYLICGGLNLEYNKIVGVVKDGGVFATLEAKIGGKQYKVRLLISCEKEDDLFRFFGNRIGSKTVATDTKFAKGVGRFFKDRIGLDLNK